MRIGHNSNDNVKEHWGFRHLKKKRFGQFQSTLTDLVPAPSPTELFAHATPFCYRCFFRVSHQAPSSISTR